MQCICVRSQELFGSAQTMVWRLTGGKYWVFTLSAGAHLLASSVRTLARASLQLLFDVSSVQVKAGPEEAPMPRSHLYFFLYLHAFPKSPENTEHSIPLFNCVRFRKVNQSLACAKRPLIRAALRNRRSVDSPADQFGIIWPQQSGIIGLDRFCSQEVALSLLTAVYGAHRFLSHTRRVLRTYSSPEKNIPEEKRRMWGTKQKISVKEKESEIIYWFKSKNVYSGKFREHLA